MSNKGLDQNLTGENFLSDSLIVNAGEISHDGSSILICHVEGGFIQNHVEGSSIRNSIMLWRFTYSPLDNASSQGSSSTKDTLIYSSLENAFSQGSSSTKDSFIHSSLENAFSQGVEAASVELTFISIREIE
ncbi:hypothetical protein QQP08_005614 [Theobroma cacao]|nr:hypothetical protein QQP08_005614 [Theobroma cacao]